MNGRGTLVGALPSALPINGGGRETRPYIEREMFALPDFTGVHRGAPALRLSISWIASVNLPE